VARKRISRSRRIEIVCTVSMLLGLCAIGRNLFQQWRLNDLLVGAVNRGDLASVRSLLQKWADPNTHGLDDTDDG